MVIVIKLLPILILLRLSNAVFFLNLYPRIKLEAQMNSNAGDPLFLTPYLKKGEIAKAQELSKVPLTEKIGFESHAGFFTIDEKYNSNLYFWYFPAFSKNEKAPVMLWLQGGPGGSSLFGLFMEIGPLIVKKGGFARRKYHWSLNYHLIFIDNPVGTGFSFTDDENGYCTDENCVSKGLYNALHQFYTLFPHLRSNEFYIAGESYAGKYIPSLGMAIHENNGKNKEKINLKGMAIGNGYCDPINQMDYASYLYQLGLLDSIQKALFEKYQNLISTEINNQNWAAATILVDQLMDGAISNSSFFKMYTGFENYYNYLIPDLPDDMDMFQKLLDNDDVRRNTHVGGLPFHDGKIVGLHLALELLQSVAPIISELLSHYRMMFYNGQLDIIVAYPLTENFLRNLKFSSSQEYANAQRKIWLVGDEIAGYVKHAGNLTEVLVRNSGHMVPNNQPKWAFDMINRFVKDDF